MTPAAKRAATMAARRALAERSAQHHRLTAAIVAAGHCPQCGAGLRRNLALTGWWQCAQLGAPDWRADPAAPACSWQGFTD